MKLNFKNNKVFLYRNRKTKPIDLNYTFFHQNNKSIKIRLKLGASYIAEK